VLEHGHVGEIGKDKVEPQNNYEDGQGEDPESGKKQFFHGRTLFLLPVMRPAGFVIPSTEGTGFLSSAPSDAAIVPADGEDDDDENEGCCYKI
jgi:hypothetical protein